MKKIMIVLLLPLAFCSCLETIQANLPLTNPRSGGGGPLDEQTVIAGLKEALQVGTRNAVGIVSRRNGYFGNSRIAIPLPPELAKVGDTLRRIGLGRKVDEFVETSNRAAEEAAAKAADIFVDAVSRMTVADAMDILRGADNAATAYFERKTRSALYDEFLPAVTRVLDQAGVTRLYQGLVQSYNAVPGAARVSFDLNAYVTNKALNGLFVMLADEEKKIRKDPAARVTDLLRQVFGQR